MGPSAPITDGKLMASIDEFSDTSLDTINDDGRAPKTRVKTAMQAKSIYDALLRSDTERAKRRALVKGMTDGNPPYRQSDLRAEGLDYRCNINFRISESYLNNAWGAFYDVKTEAPTIATVKLKHKDPNVAELYSRIVTQHFDWLLKYETSLDPRWQKSQREMVQYGIGPFVFQDEYDWRPHAVLAGQLKVPERTQSDVTEWELATIEADYLPDKLWEKIIHEPEAQKVGWDIKATKDAIMNASPETQKGGVYRTWEWHQQQLKNGSLSYSMTSKTIRTVHLFIREFAKKDEPEGKISHKIILADDTASKPDAFLFEKIGRFDNWKQCVHPMYYDIGDGGFHHAVTGMGVKMYSLMLYQNRLLCNQADKAMAPKMVFKPTTASGVEDFAMQQYGEYMVINDGFDAVQVPMAGIMEEGMIFNREVTGIIASNLSQYRQNLQEKSGNPITAEEVKFKAGQQASLGKTQLNRYYEQLDGLYAEQYRRAASKDWLPTMCGAERALEFQKRCKDDGVPLSALREVEHVCATRVAGQGSEYMRQQSLDFLLGAIMPMLPESGRDSLIRDVIAARVGNSGATRYYPTPQGQEKPTDQNAEATQWVAVMKVGVPFIATDTQNPVIYAQVFLLAGAQSVQSLQQGGNPAEVAGFLALIGPAIAANLEKIKQDPSRKAVYEVLNGQFQELAKIHDELVQQLQAQAQQQQEDQANAQQAFDKTQAELQLKKLKQDVMLQLRAEAQQFKQALSLDQHRQDLVIKDATAATDIRNTTAKTDAAVQAKEKNGAKTN